MTKSSMLGITIATASLLVTKPALAVCPICTVAVGAGLGFSRWLGIDDSIAGIWVGGLIVSFVFWTFDWLEKKNINYPGKKISVIAGWYLLSIGPLFLTDVTTFSLTNNLNIGIVVGSIAFWSAADWHFYLREKNDSRVYFPFQKVAIPVTTLTILSIVFYFFTK